MHAHTAVFVHLRHFVFDRGLWQLSVSKGPSLEERILKAFVMVVPKHEFLASVSLSWQ